MQKTAALILAAGQGKRMKSTLPKVLHPCLDLPLVCHVVRLALLHRCSPIVVVTSPNAERIRAVIGETFPEAPLRFAVQEVARGTGDAARAGLAAIPEFRGNVLILYGDVPLLQPQTLKRLSLATKKAPLAFLTAEVADPTGYGRVVRQGKHAVGVVEHKDASETELAIREINAGVYVCKSALLKKCLSGLTSKNAQGEFYLTDVVALAAKQQPGGAQAVRVADADEVRGVNSRRELSLAQEILRKRVIAYHQERGVTFQDPEHTFVGVDVLLGQDATIGVGVQLGGRTKIGRNVLIEGPSVVRDSVIEEGAVVHSFSHVEGARVGKLCSVGPFGRLRKDAVLESGSRVGNFVELKKTRLGKGSKVNHLAYVGDADIGAGSNIGAGTITCNYDGVNKHPTKLGKGVFVGSNSTLVAPLDVGAGAYIAAGSTITETVGPQALAFGRARQTNREGYARELRKRQGKAK